MQAAPFFSAHSLKPFSSGDGFLLLFACPQHCNASPFPRPTNTFRAALELSGTPLPYFPEMIPQARGDHVMAPTPAESGQRAMEPGDLWVVPEPVRSAQRAATAACWYGTARAPQPLGGHWEHHPGRCSHTSSFPHIGALGAHTKPCMSPV